MDVKILISVRHEHMDRIFACIHQFRSCRSEGPIRMGIGWQQVERTNLSPDVGWPLHHVESEYLESNDLAQESGIDSRLNGIFRDG